MASPIPFHTLAAAASLALATAASPFAHSQSLIEVPHAVEHAIDRGSIPSQQEFNVTVHLKMHNEDAFHQAVQALYDPASPTYHHWMTSADLAKYAPTAAEAESVKKELQSHGLTILGSDENSFTVRAHGAAVNFERAFQTQLHQMAYKGETIRANVAPAKLTGAAGSLVDSVTGLSGFNLKPQFVLPKNPKTGKVLGRVALKKGQSLINLADYFTNNCFGASESEYLTTAGASLPVGLYTGNSYLPGTTLACGWTPSQVQSHYGLNAAYSAGFTGGGQTIVIIDAPTNSDFTTDFKNFATATGLPAVTAANYTVTYPDGVPTPLADEVYDATGETQLDIEWSHAAAPGAKINLLITPTGDWDEFEYAIQYAVSHKLGNTISLSYGLPEQLFGAYTVKGFESTIELAAAAGVAVNISSGDGGDEGTGGVNLGGDSYPGASAFATSIGGTSIGLANENGQQVEVGWGNNLAFLSDAQNSIIDPPLSGGFYAGSGGGASGFIAKPTWQSNLPGAGRHEPDISAVADPFTGAIIFAGGYVEAIGGTSLAAPVFSGIWALADEYTGKSLGQAAPMLPRLLSKITDVVPVPAYSDAEGAIIDTDGTFTYSATDLLAPVASPIFYSALWDASGFGAGEFIDLSFGTDSSLVATKGWDYVTGYGVPQGFAFIKAIGALK
jgi:subtilase family serine protease